MTNTKPSLADRILAHVAAHEGQTAKQITEALGAGYSTATKNLRDLTKAGRIERMKDGRFAPLMWASDVAQDALAEPVVIEEPTDEQAEAAAEEVFARYGEDGVIEEVNLAEEVAAAPKEIEGPHAAIVTGMRAEPTVEEIPSLADMLKAPISPIAHATEIAKWAPGTASVDETHSLGTVEVDMFPPGTPPAARAALLGLSTDPSLVAEASNMPNMDAAPSVEQLVDEVMAPRHIASPEQIAATEAKVAARTGSLADIVLAAMQPGAPVTPYEMGRAITRSAGAVANAFKRLAEQGHVRIFTAAPVRYVLADEGDEVIMAAPRTKPVPFAKRAPVATTGNDAAMHEPEPHLHPMPIGAQADLDTYLHQHPMIEVFTAGLTLNDTKQDLEETIGKRTVRYFDYQAQRHLFDAQAPAGGQAGDVHNVACAVVGTVFEPDTNHARLTALDAVTAPWGGRTECGEADIAWSHNNRRLADCETWMRVTLPRSISAVLTVDGNERRVMFLGETHNDSSRTDRFHVAVWSEHSQTAILLRGTAKHLIGRHTRRSLTLTKERIEKLAAELPTQVAAYANLLREMAATFVDADETLRLCLVIANRGRDVFDDDSGSEETLWERARAMYLAVVNGRAVPRSPLADEGLYTAHAIFESAALIENTNLTWDAYARKLVAGETFADVALRLLTKHAAVVTEHVPGHWSARLAAAEQLPAIDPMPDGHTLPAWVNLADLRRTWCTTLAPDPVAADERVAMLSGITDPLRVLAIVAPYVPVKTPAEPTSAAYEAVHGSAA